MVGVEDIVTDSMGTAIWEWFEPHFDHPFLNIHTVAVPDALKPIPVRWIDEVQIDEGCFNADGGDLFGEDMGGAWSHEEGSARLREALARLDLPVDHVAHPTLDRMNRQELASEKRRVKQELKRHDAEFQKQFSRLPSHAEKEPMRPLYVYYRKLKTMIVHAEQSSKHGRRNGGGGSGDESRFGRESLATIQDVDDTPRTAAQIAALEARIEALQGEKSAVRQKLQAFQEKFVTENNRKIRFHKDILPIEREYRAYKNVKEDIQKVETQLRDLRAAEL